MADTKISALPAVASVLSTDVLPCTASGNTSKVTFAAIASATTRSGTFVGFPADGTITAKTFSTAFPATITSMQLTASDYSGADGAVCIATFDTLTLSGFNGRVSGGLAGSTCTLHYTATGT